LISVLEHGVDFTIQLFNDFIQEISTRNKTVGDIGFGGIDINNWTSREIGNTSALIQSQAEKIKNLNTDLYKTHLFSTSLKHSL